MVNADAISPSLAGRAPALFREVLVLGSLEGVDAAFRLGPAAPAAGAGVFARRRPAGAGHAADRLVAAPGKRMRRQSGIGIDRRDLLARNARERIEFQPRPVVLDHRDVGAEAALKTLAAVDPAVEWRQCARQRLDLADPTTGIGIGKPQFAIGVLARQRFLAWLDRADVAQAEA